MTFCESEEQQKCVRDELCKEMKKLAASDMTLAASWRRRRDSNPRTAFDGYTISNRARSTSYATSPSQLADSLNGVSFISITDEEQICKCFLQKNFRRKKPPEMGEL